MYAIQANFIISIEIIDKHTLYMHSDVCAYIPVHLNSLTRAKLTGRLVNRNENSIYSTLLINDITHFILMHNS